VDDQRTDSVSVLDYYLHRITGPVLGP
jgi:hypothetical protein